MSQTQAYPHGVEYRAPRPRGTWVGALLGSLLGLAVTKGAGGALVGGAVGSALANQPPPLEVAVRQFFAEKNLPVIGFYRPSPYAARVAFVVEGRGGWVIESRAPQNSGWTDEMLEDWLYGDLIMEQFPAKISKIQSSIRQ